MIMAAGVGSRLEPLTKKVPKPMIPVANKPIMELILKHLQSFGINDVVANTHFLADAIHKAFGKDNHLGVNFKYVYEKELSGTAGGVKKCEWFFDHGEDFVVVSADALTDFNLTSIVESHKKSGAIVTMGLKEINKEEVVHFGVVVTDKDSKVIEFQEKPSVEQAKSNLVNTGIYIFKTDIFKYIPANTFYDFAKNVFPLLLENNKAINTHVIKEYWTDIGTLKQYKSSCFDILDKIIEIEPPYDGKGWCDSSSNINCSYEDSCNLVAGKGTFIDKNVKLSGNVIIGDNCIIKEGARIKDSIIWDNVILDFNSTVENSIVSNNVLIGKNSVVSDNSVIPDSYKLDEGITFSSEDPDTEKDLASI